MKLIYILLATTLLVAPATAQTCHPAGTVLQDITSRIPIARAVKLNSFQTTEVLAWYNAQPPASEDKYDLAYIVMHQDGQIGLLFGNGDQICIGSVVPPTLVESLMRAIEGVKA